MGATSYIRSLGVPCSQYIDDRHVGQLTTCRKSPKSATAWSDFESAEAAAFIAAGVLISLGYFIGLAKSSLLPKRIVKFLGFLVDSQRCAFILPEDKKHKLAVLIESILDKKLCTPGANKGVKTQSSTPFSNRFTIFHCAVTLTSSCISLCPPATQLMRLPECSQIRIASSPLLHEARFTRFSVRIPLTLCLWILMSNLMRRGYLRDTSRPFIPPCPVVSMSSPRLFPRTKTLTSSLRSL